MTSPTEKAQNFASLHKVGDPLILFNAWDPGSAKIVAGAGAKAIATGSWSVAAAFGYEDGEALPRDLAIENIARIARAVDLPVSIDLEGGYGDAPDAVAESAALAIEAGAIGCNFEDRRVGSDGLHSIEEQVKRIAAIRAASDAVGVPFFINARTDYFLQSKPEEHAAHIEAALERGRAYAEAGANGLFVPGLGDEQLIAAICAESPIPVNIMVWTNTPPLKRLAELGVARISHAGAPWALAMEALAEASRGVYSPG
ncbi:MAG: isocitrate lyase/phosphoenolpyruvate mutase family protein [Sphingosinicella sp.]|nr:isocitrate lyase/phosphoenolpyruvate mutase family protein [Sphingosinicella sp.]